MDSILKKKEKGYVVKKIGCGSDVLIYLLCIYISTIICLRLSISITGFPVCLKVLVVIVYFTDSTDVAPIFVYFSLVLCRCSGFWCEYSGKF